MRYELHDKENDGAEYKHVDYDVGLQGMELVLVRSSDSREWRRRRGGHDCMKVRSCG